MEATQQLIEELRAALDAALARAEAAEKQNAELKVQNADLWKSQAQIGAAEARTKAELDALRGHIAAIASASLTALDCALPEHPADALLRQVWPASE